MQARTDRRSSCSAEMFFAGAPSCVRLFFIQGKPDRFSTFTRAMLFPSCSLSIAIFVWAGTPACCALFFVAQALLPVRINVSFSLLLVLLPARSEAVPLIHPQPRDLSR